MSAKAGHAHFVRHRGLGGADRLLVILQQQRHGRRRHVEDGLGIDAEQDGQDDQRRQHQDLAPVEVGDRLRARGFSSTPKITLR